MDPTTVVAPCAALAIAAATFALAQANPPTDAEPTPAEPTPETPEAELERLRAANQALTAEVNELRDKQAESESPHDA